MQETSLALRQRETAQGKERALSSYTWTDRDVTSVWRIVRRLGVSETEADDVTQEVFLIVSEKRERIIPGKERSFLYGVALRVAKQSFISARRALVLSEIDRAREGDVTQEELVDQRKARDLLDRILVELPFELRAVFVLFEIEDLSTAEIAETLALPQGTVASRLHRAREVFHKRVARWKIRQQHGGGGV